MRLPFGFTLTRQKSADMITHVAPPTQGGWWPLVRESFSGAWQRGVVTPVEDALTHPTFWSCVTLAAGDVAKCRVTLVEEDDDGIESEIENAAYSPVLRRPNHYQNRIQFYSYWVLSKLTRGNAYALKERDNRGVVTALYLLDPTRVRPMVATSGDVYYALGQDLLAGVDAAQTVVPAREIIHDTMFTPYHPLVGMSPIYAAGHAVIQAQQILHNSSSFFKHGSQVGGILTAPGQISPDTAKRLEEYWANNYAGEKNAGKVAVLGDGLKYEKPQVMSAVDAQLIDQLKWDDEKVCSVFHIPPYMVGVGPPPTYNNIEALNQQYYSQCLQLLIESLELSLSEGLDTAPYEIEFDLDGLLRMDSATKMKTVTDGIKGGVFTPNEGRAKFNKSPLPGGDTVYLQEQDHSLEWLAKRDAQPIPAPSQTPTQLQPGTVPPTKTFSDDTIRGIELMAAGIEAERMQDQQSTIDRGELLSLVMKKLAA